MTPEQRSCVNNGIWLCSTCADLIDNDASRFSVELLHAWKLEGENSAKAEQGRRLPTERELSVYKAKALGENVSAQSVGDLITEVHRVGVREIERLDPRFTAEISRQGQTTTITLIPREPVNCKLHITPEFAREFSEKMANLRDHGQRLEINAKALKVEGTEILKPIGGYPGTVAFETHLRYKAIQRLTWSDVDSGSTTSAEIIGEVVGGARSCTFSGALFDGLYEIRYRLPLDRQGEITLDFEGSLNLSRWESRTLCKLPYFDKFYRLSKALCERQTVHMNLEIEGQEVLAAECLGLMSHDDARATFNVLHHLSRVRDILHVLETDIPFQLTVVTAEDGRRVNEVWFLLCKLKTLRGHALGTATATVIPTGPVETENLKRSITESIPTTLQYTHLVSQPLNLLGKIIALNDVNVTYTKLIPTLGEPLSTIQPGKGVRLKFVPTDDCEAEVTVAKNGPKKAEVSAA